jgi:MFS transporter, PAT family, beta-lactamase induction signal transducer AmpG
MAVEPKRSRRALAWVLATYFGEGLPWSVLHQMGTEFLTATGASLTQISSTSLLHLAVTFKFLWSPVVDFFGTKRRWVVATQVILGFGMFALGRATAAHGYALFWLVAGAFSIVHATHDIACDGFYMRALDRHDQALHSGTRMAGYRAAMYVGSSLLVKLAAHVSWLVAFSAAGAIMLGVAVLNALTMPHVAEGDAPTARAQEASPRVALGDLFKSFFVQPQAARVLAFMFLYRLGDIMMFAMSKPLLKDLGVDTSHRADLNGIGILATVIGALTGGWFVARWDLRRTLAPILYLQNFAILLYVALAVFRPSYSTIAAFVIIEQLVAGAGASGQTVFLMQRSRGLFSASHYAFATAIVSLGSTLSGFISGPLNQHFGHPIFFMIAFVASWPALVLVWFVPKAPVEVSEAPRAA